MQSYNVFKSSNSRQDKNSNNYLFVYCYNIIKYRKWYNFEIVSCSTSQKFVDIFSFKRIGSCVQTFNWYYKSVLFSLSAVTDISVENGYIYV